MDRGELLALFAGLQCPGSGVTCVSVFAGTDPTPAPCTDPDVLGTCRRHLDGTGTFAVPLTEFQANAIVLALLRPDVDLDGDAVEDAMSFGERIHVTGAGFTLP